MASSGKRRRVERVVHHRHPAVARLLIQPIRMVSHAQAGVAALLLVARRAAEAADQEVTQPGLRAGHIILRIHRPEQIVRRHLGVERLHQPLEAVFPNARKDLPFRLTRRPPCSVATLLQL